MATSTLNPVVITSQGAFGVCPSQEERENAIQTIKTFVQSIQESYANNITSTDADVNLNPFCGEGEWYQVANLNMSDSSQQCPSAWREYTTVTESEHVQDLTVHQVTALVHPIVQEDNTVRCVEEPSLLGLICVKTM